MSAALPSEPVIVQRVEQPYVAIKRSITMDTFAVIADRLSDVFSWIGERRIEPADPPFFRYDVIDMEHQLEVEAGVPIASPVSGDGEIFAAVLPAGRNVTVTHVGHPDELVDVTAALLAGPRSAISTGTCPRAPRASVGAAGWRC